MAISELIEFTGKGREDETWHAADLLIFTKQTRLEMTSGQLEEVKSWSEEKKRQELEYMAGTIPSSWEFIEMTFLLSGVSRAAAQQITRTRTGSYAMQSLRVVDASGLGIVNTCPPGSYAQEAFTRYADFARFAYKDLVEGGASREDARGILPLNTTCTLVAKYNLRSFVDLMKARGSLRVQGEYSDLADQMKEQVIATWPWSAPFFVHPMEKAIAMLEEVAQELGLTPGAGHGWQIAKAIDLIRKG